jgi:translation initiation factor IF-1
MRSFQFLCLALVTLAMSLTNTSAFTVSNVNNLNRNALSTSPFQPTFSATISTTPTSTATSNSNSALFGKKEARSQGNDRRNKTERVKKVKDDVIEVEAVVIDSLPNAMFRCAIDGAPETQPPILSTISGKIRKNYVKILVGDKVTIELSPYDLTRGRITFRKR